MNYEKLTDKKTRNSVKEIVGRDGMELIDAEVVGDHPSMDGGQVVRMKTRLSRRQEKRFSKYMKKLEKNEKLWIEACITFVNWFMDAHDITHPPDLCDREDPYVGQLFFWWLQADCFQTNKMINSNLNAIADDPEFRKVVGIPLKYQSADMLEVA